MHSLNLDYTSFIYVNDESGNPVEYKSLYGGESNRIWVDYQDIPQYMKDAMVAIEDKRFWEHNGVDWWRTLGAATNLLSSGGSFGGSTITQQLIKNLTGESDVSISRKLKEIFRAENLEKKYTKEEILECYLNVVNFGSGCKGYKQQQTFIMEKILGLQLGRMCCYSRYYTKPVCIFSYEFSGQEQGASANCSDRNV
ncbi:MAG: transglycosylase domain-containing protein [Acutalibacteraceae bacterium]